MPAKPPAPGDDWLALDDPLVMIERLQRWGAPCYRCSSNGQFGPPRPCPSCGGTWKWPRPSPRKRRLLVCAFCRFVWDQLPNDRARQAIAVAEQFAEGRASEEDLRTAYRRNTWRVADVALQGAVYGNDLAAVLRQVLQMLTQSFQGRLASAWHELLVPALKEARRTAGRDGPAALKAACKAAENRVRLRIDHDVKRLDAEARRDLARLVGDVVGHPTQPVAVPPVWLDANGGLARMVAAGIDLDGRFDELPVLGDALEEAGCTDAKILEHARQPRHSRGCWLIDAIFGKSLPPGPAWFRKGGNRVTVCATAVSAVPGATLDVAGTSKHG